MTVTPDDRRSPLRVAQIVTTLARGGAQATVVASSDMARFGIEVTVLAGLDETEEGTFWRDPALADASVVAVPTLRRRPDPLADAAALRWLVGWLRGNRPDVVHTHSAKAGLLGRVAARIVGIPCAHTVHGWGHLHSPSAPARTATRLVERRLASLSDGLVVVGQQDLQTGLANRIGSPGRYRIIRSGVDTDLADAAARDRAGIRRELGIEDRFVVGMVARLSYPKDHANLLAAFAAADIPDSTLLLIGDGPERAAIEQLAEASGLADRVVIVGLRPDAARIVAGFDVAVLSSRWEGMPRTVVEAAAAGVPVVATDVGSVGDLIEDGVSGRLVPAGDVAAMAEALTDNHRRPADHRAMAAVAATRASAFSTERMRHDLVDLWHDLADRPHPEPGADPRPAIDADPVRNRRDSVPGRRIVRVPDGRRRPDDR